MKHLFLALGSALPALAPPAAAQCELQTVLATDGDQRDRYGSAAAMDGDWAFLGAPSDYEFDPEPGAVYALERTAAGWVERQRLVASNGGNFDYFGSALAVDGDVLVVGAYNWDHPSGNATGAAYVFERSGSTWVETQQLVASAPAFLSFYGFSVDVSGDTIVVGAFGYDESANKGSIFLYERSGSSWVETAHLYASDASNGDQFGRGVALDGDTAMVTAPWYDNGPSMQEGAVYVLERSRGRWSEVQRLDTGPGGSIEPRIADIAIDGDLAVTGGPHFAGDAGAAYVFERTAGVWSPSLHIYLSDTGDEFGAAVDVAQGRIVVGAPGADTTGRAWLFERRPNGWTQLGAFAPDGLAFGSRYGSGVALGGDTTIVGAAHHDIGLGQERGAAWIHAVGPPVTSYCTGAPNSFGPGARISSLGMPSLAQNVFRLVASYAPPAQVGLFFYGGSQLDLPFGEGRLCVGSGGLGTYRILPPLVIGEFGQTTRHLDFTAPPAGSGAGQIHAGSTWNVQFWYRDPAGGGSGFNTSDGLEVRFCP